jgi:Protein of unknown function (DUF2738)
VSTEMSLNENTQLTQASEFDANNIIFSKPVVSNIPNSTLTYKRIMISMKNKDGSVGDLVVSTDRLFSFGIAPRVKDGDPKDGCQLSLSMYNKDDPAPSEMRVISVFNEIVEKCKEHLLAVKDEIGYYELTKDDSLLKQLGKPMYYKKEKGKIIEGVPPILSVKLMERKGEITSIFTDETGHTIDPMSIFKKHCHVKAAIKFGSIYIGAKLLSLDIRLYEAQVKLPQSGLKRLLTPIITEPVKTTECEGGMPFDDEEDEFVI